MITRKILANAIRFLSMDAVQKANSGHPGAPMGMADIAEVLWNDFLKHNPTDPTWYDRDRFILSKGHAAPALYAALAQKGYFDRSWYPTLRRCGSRLQGHPDMKGTPGIDMSSGSLGQGISAACGMAMAAKMSGASWRVYAILGDGELQEGVCWEGANVATGRKLDHLIVFVDRNGWQSYKSIDETVGQNNPAERFRAFGWDVQEINGHDIQAIHDAVEKAKSAAGKPHCIVCDCVKGKGVSYMENNNAWHKGVPTDEQYAIAVKELGGEL